MVIIERALCQRILQVTLYSLSIWWNEFELGHTNLIVCLKAAARVILNMRINIAKLLKFDFFF